MTKKRPNSETPLEAVDRDDLSAAELRFVDEFLVDRDPNGAAMRAGVHRINLKRTVSKWMGDPKIVQAIKIKTDDQIPDNMISPQRIIAGFMEVAFDRNAPAAARNAALRELASMKPGMYPEKGQGDEKRPGVIFVPAHPSLEDWAKASAVQQELLKNSVRK